MKSCCQDFNNLMPSEINELTKCGELDTEVWLHGF